MNSSQTKQILDTTFRHLEEMLAERRQEQKQKKRTYRSAGQKSDKQQKTG